PVTRPTANANHRVERLECRVLLSAGDLDPAFGAGGKVFVPDLALQGRAEDAAAVAGGKLVVAGSFQSPDGATHYTLARYNPDGTSDPTFGRGGTVETTFAVARVLAQPDGQILAAGTGKPGASAAFIFA